MCRITRRWILSIVIFLISFPAIGGLQVFRAAAPLVDRQATQSVCPSGCNYTTIQTAVNEANPGDVIEIYSGVYNESVTISKSGTADNWITLQAAAGQGVLIEGTGKGAPNIDLGANAYWKIIDLKGQNAGCISSACTMNRAADWAEGVDGISIGQGAHDILIRNVLITRSSGDAIDLEGRNQNISILDSEVYDMGARQFQYSGDGHGIHVTVVNDSPRTKNIVVKNNFVHDSHGKACLALADYSRLNSPDKPEGVVFEYNRVQDCTNGIKVNADGVFRYNLLLDTGKHTGGVEKPDNGFQAFTHDQANNVRLAQIYNNTVVGFDKAYSFYMGSSSPAQTIKTFSNNIAFNPRWLAVRVSKTTFDNSGNNIYYCGGAECDFVGYDPEDNSNVAPDFQNTAGYNYSLKLGSPAIDAGILVYSKQPYSGLRPDIGAFEYNTYTPPGNYRFFIPLVNRAAG